MNIVSISARNIFRSKRRSLITIGAMAFALGIMVAFSALWDGMLGDMRRNATLMDMGHMQVHAPGYLDKPSIYTSIAATGGILEKIKALGFSATPRLYTSGLAAAGNASAGAFIWGVDPAGEKATVKLPLYMLTGSWLADDDPRGVVLGRLLAKSLRASVGDEIVLVSQAADGSTANALFKVRGILKSVNEVVNRAGLMMTAGEYRTFMSYQGGAHEIVVKMPEKADLDESLSRLSAALPDLDVKSWKQLNPSLAEIIDISSAFQIPMIALIYIAIAIVILNAMLMAVFERIREYGVMKAIGVTPGRVFAMVMCETAVMTLAASAAGLAFGIPLTLYLQKYGIDLSHGGSMLSFSGVAFDPVWRAQFSARCVLMPLSILTALVTLATLYPAARAARLNPVRAIRYK